MVAVGYLEWGGSTNNVTLDRWQCAGLLTLLFAYRLYMLGYFSWATLNPLNFE